MGVALFHRRALPIAAAGLFAVIAFKWLVTGFAAGPGLAGLAAHFAHEWVILVNLFLLLVGFALLAAHFEESGLPQELPALACRTTGPARSRCSRSCSCFRRSSTTSRPR